MYNFCGIIIKIGGEHRECVLDFGDYCSNCCGRNHHAVSFYLVCVWGNSRNYCKCVWHAARTAGFVSVNCVIGGTNRNSPICKKFLHVKETCTNADRCIGKKALVLQTIINKEELGQVRVNGSVWTARAEDDDILEKGTTVTVKRIEGVKLIVSNQ